MTESILIINSKEAVLNKSLENCKKKYGNYIIIALKDYFLRHLSYRKVSHNIT